jgi:hypothetical protein
MGFEVKGKLDASMTPPVIRQRFPASFQIEDYGLKAEEPILTVENWFTPNARWVPHQPVTAFWCSLMPAHPTTRNALTRPCSLAIRRTTRDATQCCQG